MRRCALLIAAALGAAPSFALAQAGSGTEPVISVTARAISPDGSSRSSAGGTDPVVIGKPATHYLHAGRLGEAGICIVGSSNGKVKGLDDLLKTSTHVWKVTTTGVSSDLGRQTVDLEWARYDDGHATPATSRKQRVTLAQGEPLTLDMLHNANRACSISSVVLELETSTREDPALADTMLKYDLWLVRTDASGKKETRHFVMTGRQGSAVPFNFAPLRSDVPALKPNQYDFDVLTSVAGELRGRARQDGRVAVEMVTSRQDSLHRSGQTPAKVEGLGEGRKVVEAGFGESVEIRLPSRRGTAASYATPEDAAAGQNTTVRASADSTSGSAPPAQAVEIRNGRVVVNYASFFANETVSLILRVTKAESGAEMASR